MLFDTDVFETGRSVEVKAEQVVDVEAQKEKVIDDVEGDDVNKDTTSSLDSSDEEVVDETEHLRRIQEETEKEKLLRKRKRQEKDDDDVYIPFPEHVSQSQSPKGSKKKTGTRKKVVSQKARKVTPKIKIPKIVLKKKQTIESNKPPTPPHEPIPPQSPIHHHPDNLLHHNHLHHLINQHHQDNLHRYIIKLHHNKPSYLTRYISNTSSHPRSNYTGFR
ncbi:hypothetical protein Hanom_Chr10g00909991 [Helianthus anomalus]